MRTYIAHHLCELILQDFLGARLPDSVTIVEVGPRDGLQNEKQTVLSTSAWLLCKHPLMPAF